jgi:predicted aspartyl protease
MGTFSVSIQVGAPAGQQFIDIEALVDTGASDTVLPGDDLAQLGIPAIDRSTYRLADEQVVEYEVGRPGSVLTDGNGRLR